jgi:hypothetical protein
MRVLIGCKPSVNMKVPLAIFMARRSPTSSPLLPLRHVSEVANGLSVVCRRVAAWALLVGTPAARHFTVLCQCIQCSPSRISRYPMISVVETCLWRRI